MRNAAFVIVWSALRLVGSGHESSLPKRGGRSLHHGQSLCYVNRIVNASLGG